MKRIGIGLWIVSLLVLGGCGSDESERTRCVRLCEKAQTCTTSFAFKVCTDWCETLDDDDNDKELHPKMTACLSIEDCDAFYVCLEEARVYLGVKPAAATRRSGDETP